MIRTFLIVLLCLSMPALAQTPAKKSEVPFRSDSGLITAEYELATGKYMQAITTLGTVLTRHPNSADAYTYRGYAYQQLGDIAKAAESYKKALLLDPAHLGALKYKGDLFLMANDQARAIEQLQAIRMVCGNTDCAELAELQAAINKSKMAAKPVED